MESGRDRDIDMHGISLPHVAQRAGRTCNCFQRPWPSYGSPTGLRHRHAWYNLTACRSEGWSDCTRSDRARLISDTGIACPPGLHGDGRFAVCGHAANMSPLASQRFALVRMCLHWLRSIWPWSVCVFASFAAVGPCENVYRWDSQRLVLVRM